MALKRDTKVGLYILVVTLFVSFTVYVYQAVFSPNILVGREAKMLYIPTGASFTQVTDSLQKGDFLEEWVTFRALARATGYMDKVRPGAYLIQPDSPNIAVIRMLMAGRQTPVKVTFNNVRLLSDLARKLDEKLGCHTFHPCHIYTVSLQNKASDTLLRSVGNVQDQKIDTK
jgi:UPF0755 protein